MALFPVLLGFIAAVAWGIGDYVGARASKKLSGYTTAFLVLSVGALTYSLVYALLFRSHTVFDGQAMAFGIASGILFTLGNLAFYKGLELGPVNLVSPLGSLYPFITTLLLVLVFGASLSMQQGVGVVIVVLGAMVAAGMFQRSVLKRRLSRGALLGLTAALFYGVALAFIAQAVGRVGWQLASLIELVAGCLFYLPLLPFLNRGRPDASPISALRGLMSPLVLSAGILIETGFLAVTIGIGYAGDMAPTIIAVSACYPVLTVFLALKHMKEEFQLVPLLGAFTAIGGVVVLSLG